MDAQEMRAEAAELLAEQMELRRLGLTLGPRERERLKSLLLRLGWRMDAVRMRRGGRPKKYAEYQPFLDAYGDVYDNQIRGWDVENGSGDETPLAAMADLLQENGDIRHHLIRRYIGQTQAPEYLRDLPHHQPWFTNGRLESETGDLDSPGGRNRVKLAARRVPGQERPSHVLFSWTRDVGHPDTAPSILTSRTWNFVQPFTPEEIAAMAEEYPEYGDSIRGFLGMHFPDRFPQWVNTGADLNTDDIPEIDAPPPQTEVPDDLGDMPPDLPNAYSRRGLKERFRRLVMSRRGVKPKRYAAWPEPEEGNLNGEQLQLLHAAHEDNDLTALGALGDSLADLGFARSGMVLAKHATRSHNTHYHERSFSEDKPVGKFRYSLLRDGSELVHRFVVFVGPRTGLEYHWRLTDKQHHAANYSRGSSVRRRPRRYAKADGHLKAHPLVAGFPIEHALRHLANDAKNSSQVRNLALIALTGRGQLAKLGDPSDKTPSALWALHDALRDEGHEASEWYNWLSASDKVQLDAKVYQALRERSQDIANYFNYHEAAWEATPESSAVRYQNNRNGMPLGFGETHKQFLDRRIRELAPEASDSDIQESLNRHYHRANMEWVRLNTPGNLDAHVSRAAGPYVPNQHALEDREDAEKATRYHRRRVAVCRFRRRYAKQKIAPVPTPNVTASPATAKKPTPKKPTPKPVVPPKPKKFPGEKILSPRDRNIAKKGKTFAQYHNMLSDSVEGREGLLPTVEEIKSLAQAGESVRGQYAHSFRVLTKFIGRDNAHLFWVANGILSPNSPWEKHSRTAMRALRFWRESQAKKGARLTRQEIASLVDRLPNEKTVDGDNSLYGSLDWKVKRDKLIDLFANPSKYIRDFTHMAKERRGKIVDFTAAALGPDGVPLDTHQSKAAVPQTVAEIHRAIDRLYKPKPDDNRKKRGQLRRLREQSHKDLRTAHATLKAEIGQTPSAHQFAHALSAETGTNMASALLEAQKALVGSTVNYKAYKAAVGQAAHEMGWEPREVQESMWTAVVSIVAARRYGIAPERILDILRHEDAFRAWDVGTLLTTPEITRDLSAAFGLSPRLVNDFRRAARRKPAVSGKINVGNRAAYETVARRIPVTAGGGDAAWNPIEDSLRERGAAKKSRRGLLIRLQNSNRGSFIDALRKVRSSHQEALRKAASDVAHKLGLTPADTLDALHDSPRGSVPGVAQAVYGSGRPEDVNAAAAWYGLVGNLPGVAVFHYRPTGPDSLYRMRQAGSGLDIRAKLDRHGILDRVLIPHKKGYDVLVPDRGNLLSSRVRDYARVHGVQVQKFAGHFGVIGAADQDRAREKFRTVATKPER